MKTKEILWVAFVLILIVGATSINMSLSRLRSRDMQRKADLNSVARAMQVFHDRFAYFPESVNGNMVSCGDPAYRLGRYYFDECVWGENKTPLYGYEGRIPTDPKVLEGYKYVYLSDGTNYKLLASLEDPNDPEIKPDIKNLNISCGVKICNFAVVSKNDVY
jgi:hypothetical protein